MSPYFLLLYQNGHGHAFLVLTLKGLWGENRPLSNMFNRTYLNRKVNITITVQPKITQLTQLFILIRLTSIYLVNISYSTQLLLYYSSNFPWPCQ
jgi:hypothetical protein